MRTPAHREDYKVRPITHAEAQRLCELHHYAGGAGRVSQYDHGLFHGDEMVGAAVWMLPAGVHVGAAVIEDLLRIAAEEEDLRTFARIEKTPDAGKRVLALSRLVVAPGEEQFAAGILLGRSLSLVEQMQKLPGKSPPYAASAAVTYADSYRKHTGIVYKATNWKLAGESAPQSVWVDAQDRLVSRKLFNHTRTYAQMEALGYRMVGRFAKLRYVRWIGADPVRGFLRQIGTASTTVHGVLYRTGAPAAGFQNPLVLAAEGWRERLARYFGSRNLTGVAKLGFDAIIAVQESRVLAVVGL